MPAGLPAFWQSRWALFLVVILLNCVPLGLRADEDAALFVLMHNSGKIERYDLGTGQHQGTLISGLPPSNSILQAPDGCWLISTGKPGEVGQVLRFDPSGEGRLSTLLDIPEGYGGRLFRATGMSWLGQHLLVASQVDGKVKAYHYPSGEWLGDVATASPGGITQIATDKKQLYLTDYAAHSIRRIELRSLPDKPALSSPWVEDATQSPWGVAIDAGQRVYWCTASGQIFRSFQTDDGRVVTELWVDKTAGLATPFALIIGPDQLLYCASLLGGVTGWSTEEKLDKPVRVIGGPELQGPASLAIAVSPRRDEFRAPDLSALAETPEKLAFFERRIRPLLHAHCLECHNENVQEARLRLDSRVGWEKGGRSGKAIEPGKPESSLLVQAVLHTDKDLKMPPDARLAKEDLDAIVAWVRSGAIDPRTAQAQPQEPTHDNWADEFQSRLDWWSLKPLRDQAPPRVRNVDWPREPIDAFLLEKLEAASLKPAAPASPEVLARRLSQVLTGLPLEVELRREFLRRTELDADSAYDWLVDELLQSPHYGERMARRWMDVVRYTDTYGYEWDNPAKGSHEYRDYLIRAFNADVPYDTLVREQIAGDLLPEPRINEALSINESIIGPMFYHLGEHRHGSSLAFNGIHQEMMNNKIDAFSKAFLATTVACARCHDHKREAVSQLDYYALGAVFMTPRWVSRPVDAPGKNAATIEQLKQLRSEITAVLRRQWSSYQLDIGALRKRIDELKSSDKPPKSVLGDVLYPLWKLYASASADQLNIAWTELAAEVKTARENRIKQNASMQTLADFAQNILPAGWVIEGEGMESGWTRAGTPLVALDGQQVIAQLLPQGLHTHALSSKLPGVLRMPPDQQVPGKFTSLLIAGGQFSGSLVLDENSFQNETVSFFNQTEPSWRTYADATLKNGVTRVTIDFATSALNANFPPRTGLAAGLPHNDLGYDKRSWLSIGGIVAHDTPSAPQNTLDVYNELFITDGGDIQSPSDLDTQVSRWLSSSVARWCAESPRSEDIEVINFLLKHDLIDNKLESDSRLATLVSRYREIEAAIEYPRTVNSMDERQVTKTGVYFNVRGNVDAMGELVMPNGLQMFAARNRTHEDAGSGRLQLAESLLDPEHPLTSRVYVNRLWQWIFGRGLVATPDDFGRLGEQPSHPELLDFLARRLVNDGWSTKRLVRMLVRSQAFRQSSQSTAEAMQTDPGNQWLHHYPTRRMEAEEVRDALLFVSGRLDKRLFGRPVNPPRTVEDASKRLYSGPLDGDGRRSLYLTMSIMAPPKFLTTFDLPDLKLPSGRRNVTNVPGQALQMLNDPFVQQQAGNWGRAIVTTNASTRQRLMLMFETAYGRLPQEDELQRWQQFISELAKDRVAHEDTHVWSEVAHAIYNTKEFIYFR